MPLAVVDYFEFALLIDDINTRFKECQSSMRSVPDDAKLLCFLEIEMKLD